MRSARKRKITTVSWRMQTPASMISRAKTGSPNHRRTGRESRGVPRERFLGADTGRARSDGAQGSSGSRIVVFAGRIELIQMTVWSQERLFTRPELPTLDNKLAGRLSVEPKELVKGEE